MLRIGVFGGSFNPPHIGHFILAERIIEILKLNKIIFIPAHIPPHKKNMHIADPEHRLNMLKLTAGNRSCFEVSDVEIKRGGTSFTYDTLLYLKDEYKKAKLFLIIGKDNYDDFRQWKNYDQIFDLCKVVVLDRKEDNNFKNQKIEALPHNHTNIIGCQNYIDKSDTSINADKFIFLKTPLLDISSTEIRKRIKAHKSIEYYLTAKVQKYIEKYNLYR